MGVALDDNVAGAAYLEPCVGVCGNDGRGDTAGGVGGRVEGDAAACEEQRAGATNQVV